MDNFFFGISLTASFLAGTLALFAPCCITFLLPSYLGTIFKEGNKVMWYTFIFALGLASILIPVALGFRFFIYFFDSYHRQIYYLGGLFLIFMGIMTLKPVFQIPMLFHVKPIFGKKVDSASVFSLGLMSGLTSSCCAPVLFAAATLTTLSPTIFQAVIVAGAYVLGIVFPLFVLSLLYQKGTEKIAVSARKKVYEILKITGAGIFIAAGISVIGFNYFGKIQMYQMEGYGRGLRLAVFQIAKYFQNPAVDIVTFIFIIGVFYWMVRRK